MERMRIAAIFADQEALGGKEVTVCGWARTIRDMKTFGFIELNDGSCFKNLQVVMSAEELANYKEIAAQNVANINLLFQTLCYQIIIFRLMLNRRTRHIIYHLK